MISNKTSATISNETNIEPPAVDGYVSSPDVTLIPDDNKSLGNVQFQHFVEIKNHICGDIKYILKQTEFASKLVELAFDETVSVQNFLVETTSTFNKVKESINDLLILCNKTLENIPSTPTTVDKIQSTEKPISRDPSIIKVFDENELRYLVNQGPYQPLLPQYPVNKQLKKKNDTCYFVPQWYKEFPLIEYSPITDSIYCFCCRLFGRGPGGVQSENIWVSSGMKMWNKVKGNHLATSNVCSKYIEQEKRLQNLVNQYTTSYKTAVPPALNDLQEFLSLSSFTHQSQEHLHSNFLDQLVNILSSKMEKIIEETTSRLIKSLQQRIKKIEKTVAAVENIISDDDMDIDSFCDSESDDDIKVLNNKKVKQQQKQSSVTIKPTKVKNIPSSTLTTTTTNPPAITTDILIKAQRKPKTTSKTVKRNRSPNSSLDSTTTDNKELKSNINED
ncbi:unnamed protein product [Rotaria sp. Silwood2]|nr:unnamed protein product [Rotaria sp. Silwood2]CAF4352787.1 unnamed protein product [Rotaria sp. Silwood2]